MVWTPSRRATGGGGGGHTARTASTTHKQWPPHHCNTIMDLAAVFSVACVRPAPNRERIHFLAPLLWMLQLRAAAAPCVLDKPFPTACACHAPFYNLYRMLAAVAQLRALPRNAWLRTDCWLLPKYIVGEMCAAPPPWSPARPTLRVLWWPAGGDQHRMQAFKRGRAMLPQTLLTAWQKLTAAPHLLPRRHPRPLCSMSSRVCPAALRDCPLLAIFYSPTNTFSPVPAHRPMLALKHVSS